MRILSQWPAFTGILLCVAAGIALLAGDDIASFIDSPATSRGFVPRELIRASGEPSRYVVFVPHVPPPTNGGGYPVLLFLNGVGENGNDGLLQISNNFGRQIWELEESFPFLAVAPQCPRGGSWSSIAGHSLAMHVLDQVLADYPGDPGRVYLTGVSSGGAAAYGLATRYPDRFAAVVPVSATNGSTSIAQTVAILSEKRIPVWLMFNNQDEPGIVANNRLMRRTLVSSGAHCRCTEYNQKGHNAWDFAYRNPALYRWLLTQSLEGRESQALFKETIYSDQEIREQSGGGSWQLLEEGEIRFSPNDEREGILWLHPPLEDVELHFEFLERQSSGIRLSLIISAEGEDKQRLHISVLPVQAGGGGVVDELSGNHIAKLDPLGVFAMKDGAWNHLSLQRRGGRIKVSMNGWNLLDFAESSQAQSQIRCGMVGFPAAGQNGTLREVRYREISRNEGFSGPQEM